MHRLEKLSAKLNSLATWVAGSALVMMMVVTVSNMLLRVIYVPFGGVSEIVAWLAAITFGLSLGFTQINRAHVDIDLLVSRFPQRLQFVVESIVYLLSTLLFIVATWQIVEYGNRIRLAGTVSETMRVVFYPVTYGVAAGFALLSLVLFLDFFKSLLGVVKE